MWPLMPRWLDKIGGTPFVCCPHRPEEVRAQKEHKRRIWSCPFSLILPITLSFYCIYALNIHLFLFSNFFYFHFCLVHPCLPPWNTSLQLSFPSFPFYISPWGNAMAGVRHKAHEEFFKGHCEKKRKTTMGETFVSSFARHNAAHKGSENLPPQRPQVVWQNKALGWVWHIIGGKVTRLPQRWSKERLCLWVFEKPYCLWRRVKGRIFFYI